MKRFIITIALLSTTVAWAAKKEEKTAPVEPQVPQSGTLKIDLATALKLGNARNSEIALAEERVKQATAQLRQKSYLIIPTLSFGASWHHAEGRLQDSSGRIRDVTRSSAFFGGGSGAVGAGPIMQPGLGLTANLADIYFGPLAARQNRDAMQAASKAANNRITLQIAAAYFDLVRARAGLAVAEEALKNSAELSKVTGDFAATGEGLQSDAQRAKVGELIHRRNLEQAREAQAVAVARLAQLLHLDPNVDLEPASANPAPVELADAGRSTEELVAAALANRPEIDQSNSMVNRAESDLKGARFGAALPNVAVGVSGGGLGGGIGGGIANTGSRTDVNALVFWRLEGLGLGEKEKIKARRSDVEQARYSHAGIVQAIIAEVRQSRAQVESRRRQIAIAEEAVKSARQSFELNRQRIFERQGLPIEVLQSIESLATARQLYIDTVTEYNQAQYRLLTAVGGGGQQTRDR